VKANQGAAGVDGQSIAEFEADLSNNLYKLWNRLSPGSYVPPSDGNPGRATIAYRTRWSKILDKRLKAHRRELIDPKIAEHRGRVVKTTGDGILIEFPSVVEAVGCAVEVQQGMADRNADVSEDKRITFRVGVNLGDIIIDGDDIYGDGVNIAARLGVWRLTSACAQGRSVFWRAREGAGSVSPVTAAALSRPVRYRSLNASCTGDARHGSPRSEGPTAENSYGRGDHGFAPYVVMGSLGPSGSLCAGRVRSGIRFCGAIDGASRCREIASLRFHCFGCRSSWYRSVLPLFW
jgi:hypothetical protein